MKPIVCLALFACILTMTAPSPGASFLPDAEDLARMSPEQRAEAEEAGALLLAGVAPDQKTIRIDDMVFDIPGDLSISSAFKGSRWVEGRVWYEFDSNVSAENRARWLEAAAEWEAVANLSFRQRTDQYSRIYVKSGDENWSKVGLGIGGKRDMEISNWNSKYVIVHEIGHALGLMHEHCRTGRGDRIIIHWDRIELGKRHNFFGPPRHVTADMTSTPTCTIPGVLSRKSGKTAATPSPCALDSNTGSTASASVPT